MSGRTASSSRPAATAVVSIDLVLVAYRDRILHVHADRASKSRGLSLPWGIPARGESLDAMATRMARKVFGTVPNWMEQVGAFADNSAHPAGSSLSICYAGVVPWTELGSWRESQALSALAERQRRMVTESLTTIRTRLEQTPVAFSFLARDFTLSELQQAYETVLARRLHKASFRRSLQAAFLVEPTGEWRSEGRGRPAQLYRYAPRRRKSARRGVRLDLL
jgi:8-oxo-dGTP diphosphatase